MRLSALDVEFRGRREAVRVRAGFVAARREQSMQVIIHLGIQVRAPLGHLPPQPR
jgi:hypothetical protein